MNGRSEWGWLPPSDEGIWRYGAAWMRPFAASAPWLTLAMILGLAALAGGHLVAAPGIVFDLPASPVQDVEQQGIVALVLPLARESGGGEETFVFLDDARFTLSDPASAAALQRSLEERSTAGGSGVLQLLADRRIPAGDMMKITGLARKAGVKRVQIAEKRD